MSSLSLPELRVYQLTMIPTETYQGFQESTDWPNGLVRRVQAQQAHEDFMQALTGADTVMIKIPAVETLLRHRGQVRDTYFPDGFTVITSGVIHDATLGELRWTRERNAAHAFGPDFHIPTDYPVYGDMDEEDRKENIKKMMDGTKWMHDKLQTTPIKVVPLVKGFTTEERAICYKTLRSLDTSYCAYYGAQYFGGKMGNGINKLEADVKEVITELGVDKLLLIGLQSRDYLARMPPEVVAAAGQRWIDQSSLRDVPPATAQQRYRQWRDDTEEVLGGGQSVLGSFTGASEVVAHG